MTGAATYEIARLLKMSEPDVVRILDLTREAAR